MSPGSGGISDSMLVKLSLISMGADLPLALRGTHREGARARPESGVGFLGCGSEPPPHQLEGLGER